MHKLQVFKTKQFLDFKFMKM